MVTSFKGHHEIHGQCFQCRGPIKKGDATFSWKGEIFCMECVNADPVLKDAYDKAQVKTQ